MHDKSKCSAFYVAGARFLLVFLFVGLVMTALAGTALAQDPPTEPYLYVEDVNVLLQDGTDSFWVPIKLQTSNTDDKISSVVLALNYDESCLSFDSQTDSDNDGIPDSVRATHGDLTYSVWYFHIAGDGRSDIVLVTRSYEQNHDGSMTWMDLAGNDGKVAEIQFKVKQSCRTNGDDVLVDFTFPTKDRRPRLPSVSDEWGQSLVGAPLSSHVDTGTYTLHFNAPPTAVKLNDIDTASFAEGQAAGIEVGALTTDDVDDNTHLYTFVDDCGSNDNYAFSISGDKLTSKGPYDYEDDVVLGDDHKFMACVRSTDPHGAFTHSEFTINVTDVNEPGVEIALSSTQVNEHMPVDTPVGVLSTNGDPDQVGSPLGPDTHTYDLAASLPDCPGTDNASFKIAADELQTNAQFDVQTADSYLLCVRSTDTGANELYQAFTIEIVNENEAPNAVDDPGYSLVLADTASPYLFDVLTNDSDPDPLDELSIGETDPVAGPILGGSISLVGSPATQLEFTPDIGYSGPVSFMYKAKDLSGIQSSFATVSLWVVSDEDRGDCNTDGVIDAADFSATQLEMWDTDPEHVDFPGKPDWRTISLGGYAGSPIGCDSNRSLNGLDGSVDSVDVADVTCTVRLFFNQGCEPLTAASEVTSAASLEVGSELNVATGGSVVVPIELDTVGQNVAAAAFWVEYNPALFSVVADAVVFNVPDGVVKVVNFDEPGLIKVALFGVSLPFPLLQGAIANITLDSKAGFSGQSAVTLSEVSVSSDLARSLPVDIDDGFITIGTGDSLFLPMLQAP